MSESRVEIRVVDPEEFITLGVNRYAFGKSPQKPDLEKERANLKYTGHTIAIAAFADGVPQASCGVLAMTENVRDAVLPMGGIGGVASFPAGRRKGYVRDLMTFSYRHLREQGMPISTLYPFRDSFYARLGYASMPKNRFTVLKPERLVPLVRASLPGEVEQVLIGDGFDDWWAFLQRLQAERHGLGLFHHSRAVRWKDENEDWLALVREDGEITGAMRFRIEGYGQALTCDRFHATTPAARYQLLAWIGRHADQVSEAVLELGPDDYPELWFPDLDAQSNTAHEHAWPPPMGRVISVDGLGGLAAGDGEIAVTLVDDQCPWNDGVWTLTGEGGVLSVRQGGDPACTLTIQGLSGLVWAGIDPAEFAFRGWGDPDAAAQATLRTLFPWRVPMLAEKF